MAITLPKRRSTKSSNPDITINYHGGNALSNEANSSKTKASKKADAARILALISKRKKGLTCDETEELTGLTHQSASARFSELKKRNRIFQHGKRPTRSGRNAGVYFATAQHVLA